MFILSLFFGGAYFFGAVPFSLIVSSLRGVDLRGQGSGNLGATNVYRVMGIGWAVLVFGLDLLKGFLPVFFGMLFLGEAWSHVGLGLLAILGHSFSCFVKFKGGKGVATGLGVVLALNPAAFGIVFPLGILIIWGTRMVSLASISCAILLPVLFWVLGSPQAYVIFIGVAAGLVVLRHHSNIRRLIEGKENRI